jgi:hypothetical protein
MQRKEKHLLLPMQEMGVKTPNGGFYSVAFILFEPGEYM